MTAKELSNLIKKLSSRIVSAHDNLRPNDRNEEWTKSALILPLLEGLGWDSSADISYEDSPDDVEGRLDLILKGQVPIGIEAKAFDVAPPRNHDHPQIIKGLKQSKERGTSYFIWTNGNCWQFFSLALLSAPFYEIILSSIEDGVDEADIADRFLIIEKEHFASNPEIFDEAIRANWKMSALPAAWEVLLEKHMDDLLKLAQKGLPPELEIKDAEILEFLTTLKLPEVAAGYRGSKIKQPKIIRSSPQDWEQLLDSFEPEYERARKRFNKDFYLKLGRYLISQGYKPWSSKTTWRLIGLPDDGDEKKKGAPVVTHFKEWGFIKQSESREDMYERVEDGVPYLKKLFE